MNARIEWAARLIAAGRPIECRYGSPHWLALPEGSPAKIAAVVVAAESWAREGDELEDRLWAECVAASRAHKQVEDAEYAARRDAHRESWTGHGFKPDPRLQDEIETEWHEWIGGAA